MSRARRYDFFLRSFASRPARRSFGEASSRQTIRRRGALQFEPLEPRLVMAGQPVITEFMASNHGTLLDGDGAASDWIEIHNPTTQAINLAGWHLTDNLDNLDKWTFSAVPQAILDPGEYLIVFASGKSTETYIDSLGYMHTDFNLDAAGEFLALTAPDETIVSSYSPTYPPQLGDISYGQVQNIRSLDLVGPTSRTSVLVPTTGALDAPAANVPPAWTLPNFNDAAWTKSASGVGVGFDNGGDDGPVNIPNGTELPGLIGFDLTDPEEDGVPNGTITAGGSDSSPGNERPPQGLDNTVATKWLSFAPTGTFYQFRFANGQRSAVNGYTITSANDAPERDPYSWTLSGSNDGVNFTVVDTRNAQDFADRFETRIYEFSNNVAYEYYKFDFKTEFGVTGGNQPNSIQMAEIELLSTGPVSFAPLLNVDVAAPWAAAQSSVYQRVEFNIDDPAKIQSLLLEMQYDDGFVAYLNGTRVGSAAAPALPNYQSPAQGEREDADSLVPEKFNLTKFVGLLTPGKNVLAIHVLNVDDASPDLLSVPKLTATELVDATVHEAYMLQPSPGFANASEGITLGPLVSDVTDNPPRPADADNLVITAHVAAQDSPISGVTLHYRVMFGAEVPLTMRDDGVGADALAGDGVYTATIPASASGPGQMVRWYVTATDAVSDSTRYPLYLDPTNSPQYFGTVVKNTNATTQLPVFEYFVQDVAASSTDIGTRASVYYLDQFYDNVFIRHRGGNTTNGRKFEFNDGYHFQFDPAYGRVDEINLNERGAEATYMRQVMSWEIYNLAGVPASIGEAWYTRLNGNYLDVRIFVEQPDADLLRRVGLDENGAFYKVGADGVENSVTSSTRGVTKRTRKNEDNSDLQALVNGVNPSQSSTTRSRYVFDNIDIAEMINYIAATSIVHDNDAPHKNYHLYRDTEGSGQWMMIPWDKDLTFGLNFGVPGITGNIDPYSHPFFGDQQHQKVDSQWNRMIDAVLKAPGAKEMLVRRLRTLMDEFLGPPGTTNSWVDQRVAQLRTVLQPLVGSGSWTTEVNKIINEYLVERRQHLYVDHSITNPGYPDNAKIPAAQLGNPLIQFGTVDANPTGGNQDQEYIQLTNPNATAVDISGWRITGGIDYTLRAGTVIPAGGTMYIAADVPSFRARSSGPRGGQMLFVQGNYSGRLSNFGSTLQLLAADNSLVSQINVPGTPGPYQGEVLFSEVHYHPADPPPGYVITDLQLEFIEIQNRTPAAISLANWQVRDGVTYDFATGASIAGNSTLLLVPFSPADATLAQEFRTLYDIDPGFALVGPYSGQLSNGGETVTLYAPNTTPGGQPLQVDRITWTDQAPWPGEESADGGGQSLTRTAPTASGESVSSWAAATPTPGSTPALNLADFGGDYVVDGTDFLAWQRNVGRGSAAMRSQGDADRDGDVDTIDLGTWMTNFGATATLAAAVQLPPADDEAESRAAAVLSPDLVDLALAVASHPTATPIAERMRSTARAATFRPPMGERFDVAQRPARPRLAIAVDASHDAVECDLAAGAVDDVLAAHRLELAFGEG